MITVRGRVATIGEAFFDEPVDPAGVDLIRYVQRSAPVPGTRCREFPTLLLDLSGGPDVLWDGFHRWNRKKIRRAERSDGLVYESWYPVTETALEEFCDFYERVVSGARLLGRRQRLLALAATGRLDLSAIGRSGERLSWHAHYRTAARVRELHSVTITRGGVDPERRALIGRAHRLQHWRDIRRFHSDGIATYDFAGLSLISTDAKKLGIDAFKRSFGGTIVREFVCLRPLTPRGRLALLTEDLLAWAARLRLPTRPVSRRS